VGLLTICKKDEQRTTTSLSLSLSSICVAWLSGHGVHPLSFFVVAGHHVLVMWVLAVNRQWAVDGGGAVLVGWVVIGVVGLLTICKRTTTSSLSLSSICMAWF